jgi:hypothetical protein
MIAIHQLFANSEQCFQIITVYPKTTNTDNPATLDSALPQE